VDARRGVVWVWRALDNAREGLEHSGGEEGERLVRRCASDNDVIDEADLKQFRGFSDSARDAMVGVARRRVAAWMIMDEHEAPGRGGDGRANDLAGMRRGFIERADADEIPRKAAHLCVQHERDEMLFVGVEERHERDVAKPIGGARFWRRGFLRRQTLADPERLELICWPSLLGGRWRDGEEFGLGCCHTMLRDGVTWVALSNATRPAVISAPLKLHVVPWSGSWQTQSPPR